VFKNQEIEEMNITYNTILASLKELTTTVPVPKIIVSHLCHLDVHFLHASHRSSLGSFTSEHLPLQP